MKTSPQMHVKTGLKAGMTNPASTFCEEQGGTSTIVTDADGNQYGLCSFPDNQTFEEWNYFNTCAPKK